MLSRRCRRILLHVRIWTILLSTKRLQRPDILQEKGLAHISPFPLPVCNNDAHTAQLHMAKGLLGRHHTRLLVSSHTPIHVRLVCIRHSAALCRISGIFAMVCRTTKISHSYGCRHRFGLNQHLRRIFHGTPGGYNRHISAAARMPIFFIGFYAAWLLQQPCTKLRRNRIRAGLVAASCIRLVL